MVGKSIVASEDYFALVNNIDILGALLAEKIFSMFGASA